MSRNERFDCHYCKDSLLGKKYIMKEDTQYCTKCYENLFANCCESCSLPIGCNYKVRTAEAVFRRGLSGLCVVTTSQHYSQVPQIFTSGVNAALYVDRTCPIRIVTGTTSASSVLNAAGLSWKRPSLPRMTCCSAQSATPTITPQSVPLARKQSCQVDAQCGRPFHDSSDFEKSGTKPHLRADHMHPFPFLPGLIIIIHHSCVGNMI